jgi:hypothetical protein
MYRAGEKPARRTGTGGQETTNDKGSDLLDEQEPQGKNIPLGWDNPLFLSFQLALSGSLTLLQYRVCSITCSVLSEFRNIRIVRSDF